MAQTVKQQLLEQAVKRFGRRELAENLNVPLGVLDDWIDGQSEMPDAKLALLTHILKGREDGH